LLNGDFGRVTVLLAALRRERIISIWILYVRGARAMKIYSSSSRGTLKPIQHTM
jgi:hypothetical protein